LQQLPLSGFILISSVGSRPLKVAIATPRFSFNQCTPFLTLKWGVLISVVKFEARIVKLTY
jgi:CTP synthase (UTP-ammonia lyase)